MPTLFLQTESDPGEADWLPAASSGGESLLLIVEVEGVGTVSAPALDPDGRRNVCYVAGAGVTGIEVSLPAITPTLGPVWRFTVVTPDLTDDPACTVFLLPDGTDVFVNVPTGDAWSFLGGGSEPPNVNPGSATIVHDGEGSWAVFGGGGSFYTP